MKAKFLTLALQVLLDLVLPFQSQLTLRPQRASCISITPIRLLFYGQALLFFISEPFLVPLPGFPSQHGLSRELCKTKPLLLLFVFHWWMAPLSTNLKTQKLMTHPKIIPLPHLPLLKGFHILWILTIQNLSYLPPCFHVYFLCPTSDSHQMSHLDPSHFTCPGTPTPF